MLNDENEFLLPIELRNLDMDDVDVCSPFPCLLVFDCLCSVPSSSSSRKTNCPCVSKMLTSTDRLSRLDKHPKPSRSK